MTKFLTALALAVLSQQALAVSTIAGIDFLDVAGSVTSSAGTFATNDATQSTPVNSAVDGNAAAFTYGLTNTSTLGVGFNSAWNAADVNVTILFVGSNAHTGALSLFGGTGGASSAYDFSLTPYDGSTFTGYTGFNSVNSSPAAGTPDTLGIFALTINLADAFPGFAGTFNGVELNIYDGVGGSYDAAPSLIGATAAAVVPVPAALWLFGSGLLALAGVVRKRA
jgi:hypothetical protein